MRFLLYFEEQYIPDPAQNKGRYGEKEFASHTRGEIYPKEERNDETFTYLP